MLAAIFCPLPGQAPGLMPAYTRAELLALHTADLTPARAVRKSIFNHKLWQPRCQRKQTSWNFRRSASSDCPLTVVVDNSYSCMTKSRMQTSTIKFGLLNAHPIGNTSTEIASTISEGDTSRLRDSWPPSLYVFNSASIVKPHAIEQLTADILSYNADIVVICESHLKQKHPDSCSDGHL